MDEQTNQQIALGYALFDRLQAEYEESWLEQVFVPPTNFEAMAGMRPIIVCGESGSGKTALRLSLMRRAYRDDKTPRYLAVDWAPSFLSLEEPGSTQGVQAVLRQILDRCMMALLWYLSRHPELFTIASPWVQETVTWFIQQYLSGDHSLRFGRIEEEATLQGKAVLRNIQSRPLHSVFESNIVNATVVAELVDIVQRLGLEGIWIVVDGLELRDTPNGHSLTDLLKALLSTLMVFEVPGFALKILAPVEMKAALSSSGGVSRHRLDRFDLLWSDAQLIALTERRLALTTGQRSFRLQQLCASKDLLPWLKRYGGSVPRGWLELIRPLIEAYRGQRKKRPLSTEEWMTIRRNNPPKLRIDFATDRLMIGYQICKLPPGMYKLLRYLYEQHPRTCSRSELYYCAYRNLSEEPLTPDDAGWEPPSSWKNAFDTTLWRLRTSIEPDPDHPVYVISDRGKGVHLDNVW